MQSTKTVAVIGDSICVGYFPLVQASLAPLDLTLVHAMGGSSADLLAGLDHLVIQHQPALVHFNCGLHDLRYRVAQKDHQVELDEYAQNLRRIMNRLLRGQWAGAKVIFATTTPVIEAYHNRSGNMHRFNKDVDIYNACAVAVMSELNVPLHDLYRVIVENGIETCIGTDGRHATETGNRVLAEAVTRVIRATLAI